MSLDTLVVGVKALSQVATTSVTFTNLAAGTRIIGRALGFLIIIAFDGRRRSSNSFDCRRSAESDVIVASELAAKQKEAAHQSLKQNVSTGGIAQHEPQCDCMIV